MDMSVKGRPEKEEAFDLNCYRLGVDQVTTLLADVGASIDRCFVSVEFCRE